MAFARTSKLRRVSGCAAHATASLASIAVLTLTSCASDEVDRVRPLSDEEQAAIEQRAEQDQEHLDENIEKERRR